MSEEAIHVLRPATLIVRLPVLLKEQLIWTRR